MGRGILTTIVVVSAIGPAPPAGGACVWEMGPSFPSAAARKRAAAVNSNGTIIVLGGRPFIGETAPVHYLEPGATTWQSGPPIQRLVNDAAAGIVTPAGDIAVAGGWSFDDTGGGFFVFTLGFYYDLLNGEGDGIANFTCSRSFFGSATDDQHRLYLVGGSAPCGIGCQVAESCVERYDASIDTWTALAPLPSARVLPALVYDGLGHMLAIGGSTGAGARTTTVFSYDIVSNVWTTTTPQPMALEGQAAVLGADGLVYAVGGSPGSGTETDAVFVFDPVSATWSTGPSLAIARTDAAIVLRNDGYIYALGGESSPTGTNTVEKLDTRPPDPTDCQPNGVPDVCDIASGASGDCNTNGVPDECDIAGGLTDPCLFGGAATFVSAVPVDQRNLWRTADNTVRLTFENADITTPAPVEILIQELLPGVGAFGPDLSASFTFTVEPDDLGDMRVLRVRENGSILADRTWYAIRAAGGSWPGVNDFEVQHCVLIGDVNDDNIVQNLDAGAVFPAVSYLPVTDDDRLDVDGDGFVQNLDAGAIFSRVSFLPRPVKPTGH